MKTISIEEYTVGQHFLGAFFNGDESGIDYYEARLLQKFLQRVALGLGHWASDGDESTNFCRCEITGMYSTCETIKWVRMQ